MWTPRNEREDCESLENSAINNCLIKAIKFIFTHASYQNSQRARKDPSPRNSWQLQRDSLMRKLKRQFPKATSDIRSSSVFVNYLGMFFEMPDHPSQKLETFSRKELRSLLLSTCLAKKI